MNGVLYLIEGNAPRPGPVPVLKVVTATGRIEPLKEYLEEVNHSPDGFNVGYQGSGPLQLSYAMCRDHLGSAECAAAVYLHVCRSLVAEIPSGRVSIVTPEMLGEHIRSARGHVK